MTRTPIGRSPTIPPRALLGASSGARIVERGYGLGVRGAVWAVLGILALNVLLVGVLSVAVAVQRFRSTRAQRRLEARWRIPKLPSAAITRHRGRRFAYAGVAVAALWVFAGLAGMGPTHAVTSAVSTMVHGSDTSDGYQSRAIEPAGDGSTHPHDR